MSLKVYFFYLLERSDKYHEHARMMKMNITYFFTTNKQLTAVSNVNHTVVAKCIKYVPNFIKKSC